MADKFKNYEKETSYLYNQEDKEALCCTMDPVLIRKLNAMCAKSEDIKLIETVDGEYRYKFPKKWIKVHMPRELSDEQREACAKRAREMARTYKLMQANAD